MRSLPQKPRKVFQSDGSFIGKFGTCGKEKGQLEHPHYIAVSNTNRVIVSDSNNHRVQVGVKKPVKGLTGGSAGLNPTASKLFFPH